MELSVDVQNFGQFDVARRRKEESVKSEPSSSICALDTVSDIIDVNKINFSSDETWLYDPQSRSDANQVDLAKLLLSQSHCQEDRQSATINSEVEEDLIVPEVEKTFDSRTFTRPKKRFSRPSIEKYNEELYGKDNKSSYSSSPNKSSIAETTLKKCEEESNESSPTKPLPFDLTQPSTSYYLEKVLAANAPEIDSFQNMSPPSLVNSMCSSMFANLMENSYIKNDPLLREIRDTDFTDSVLLQDSEPPMFHSITESCSSLNSDTPESFLKKLSIPGSVRKSLLKDLDGVDLNDDLNSTFTMETKSPSSAGNTPNKSRAEQNNSESHETETSSPSAQGTYKRPSKYATYRKSDVKRNSTVLDSTFNISANDSTSKDSDNSQEDHNKTDSPNKDILNATITVESPKLKRRFEKSQAQRREALEMLKQQQANLDSTFFSESNQQSHITDSNRLSYYEEREKMNMTITKEDDTYNKRKSILEDHDEDEKVTGARDNNSVLNNKTQSQLTSSTGSADSLDRMSSSLSTSSRGSNRMLNMAEVDAIIERQEQSLHLMSTPKPRTIAKKIWENNCISPITVSESYSDSDQSSNDDFRSARSNVSNYSNSRIKNAKSLNYIPGKQELKRPNLKNVNTLVSGRTLDSVANHFRGSYTNLKSVTNGYSATQPNLNKIGNSLRGSQSQLNSRGSQSNLKTVGSTLRGSYTSLKPLTSAGSLPVAPPLKSYSTTVTKTGNPNGTYISSARSANPNGTFVSSERTTRIAEVQPIPRETITVGSHFTKPAPPQGDGQFVKPAVPRTSGLPRPVGTGIPRPASSRIPGPRKARPSSLYQPRHTGEGY